MSSAPILFDSSHSFSNVLCGNFVVSEFVSTNNRFTTQFLVLGELKKNNNNNNEQTTNILAETTRFQKKILLLYRLE